MTTDWNVVAEHLDHLGLDPEESPVYFAAWEQGFGTHFKRNGSPIAGKVDALLKQRPNCSLGFIPNPGGTKKGEITQAVALFTEDDSGASIEEQMRSWEAAMLPEPGLSVFTGNKSVHHYWPLVEPISPEQFTVLQRRLAAIMQVAHPGGDADQSLDDPNQVMRVAGAIHPKTGKPAEIRRATGERFTLDELKLAFAEAELRLNIKPNLSAAPDRRVAINAAPAGNGTHYKDLTASQRHAVVIDALRHCPERGKEGDGGYPLAQRLLAGLVHELGSAVACSLAEQADWSQDSDWDIEKVAASLESDPPAAGKRSTIWIVFTVAAEEPRDPNNPWICPWKEQQGSSTPAPLMAAADESDTTGSFALIRQWGSGWTLTEKGSKVRSNLCAGDALTELQKQLPQGFLRFNLITRLVEAGGYPITEADMERLYVLAQQAGWQVSKTSVIDAVYSLAAQESFDPVQDYLNVIAADPDLKPADLSTIATTYLGTTDPLFDRYMEVTLIGAVKRRFEPSCKFDTVTTLDGDGGIYKSEFWIVLASPDWHSSSDAEQDKDFLLILHRAWLYEQAELDYITSKKQAGKLKNQISTRRDDLRAPFGKGVDPQDRRGIMVGTVNGPFLRGDAALRRRFLVIQCPQSFDLGQRIDIEKVRRDRDAIWKAAVLAYRSGKPCFLDSETSAAASQRNLELAEGEHPWLSDLEAWLSRSINVDGPHHSNDILRGIGVTPLDRVPDNQDAIELGKAMQQVGGWVKDREPTRHKGKKARYWRKTGNPRVDETSQGQQDPGTPDQDIDW